MKSHYRIHIIDDSNLFRKKSMGKNRKGIIHQVKNNFNCFYITNVVKQKHFSK